VNKDSEYIVVVIIFLLSITTFQHSHHWQFASLNIPIVIIKSMRLCMSATIGATSEYELGQIISTCWWHNQCPSSSYFSFAAHNYCSADLL